MVPPFEGSRPALSPAVAAGGSQRRGLLEAFVKSSKTSAASSLILQRKLHDDVLANNSRPERDVFEESWKPGFVSK